MLQLKHLTVSVGDKTILSDISYTFEKGKTYAIMGPNGSGKSTFASVIMGHPAYTLAPKSKIVHSGSEIHEEDIHMRAQMGLFMSFQSPLSLSGVTIYQLLRYALQGKRDPLSIRQDVQKYAQKLNIPDELLSRSLNEDFSGGERKKMEILQACVLDPTFLIFDEIDTGVDVDALKTIANMMKQLKSSEKTFVIITHYNRLLKYITPDVVLIIRDGKIVAEGDASLAQRVEKDGYDGL